MARVTATIGEHGTRLLETQALVLDLVDTYAAVADEDGQALQADIAPGVHIEGDGALLRQAVANLIENALTHGGSGVVAQLRLQDGDGPVLALSDNGPGIPAGERGRVLERFYRLDRSRNTPGTGLGLALVAAVAKLHGASVRLDDAVPGLRVTFAFPAHRS